MFLLQGRNRLVFCFKGITSFSVFLTNLEYQKERIQTNIYKYSPTSALV